MYRIPDGFGLVKENMELSLNQEQLLAAEQIFREWQEPDPRPALLFGVTGKRKDPGLYAPDPEGTGGGKNRRSC